MQASSLYARSAAVLMLLAAVETLVGCTATKQSNTARTASEQLLISNAVDLSLSKVDFGSLAGKKILVEEKYLDSVDKGYIIGSLRDRIVRGGAHLVTKVEDADIVLEVRSGGVGTDMSNSYAGIPGITVPPMITLPEVKLLSRDRQKGIAKIGLVAYDAKTMRMLAGGGVSTSVSDDNNWYVFGIGPYQHGTLHNELRGAEPTPLNGSRPPEIVFAPPQDGHSRSGSKLQHVSAEDE